MYLILFCLFLIGCSGSVEAPSAANPVPSPEVAPAPAVAPAPEPAASPDAPADPPAEAPPPETEAPPTPEVAPEPAPVPRSPTPPVADGGACLQASDCASGICEGQGCTADAPGTCVPEMRRCTRDRRPFCGCDGETLWGSSTCVNARYERPGLCGEATEDL